MLVALALPPVNYPTTPVAGRKSVKQMIDVVCYPRLELPKSKERNTVESIKFLQKKRPRIAAFTREQFQWSSAPQLKERNRY